AQARAMLRRGAAEAAGRRLRLGRLVVDRAARGGHWGDVAVTLSPRGVAGVEALGGRAGAVGTQGGVLRSVWGDGRAATRNAVEVYVGYLRRKLDAVGAGSIVRTVRGHGYLASTSEIDAALESAPTRSR